MKIIIILASFILISCNSTTGNTVKAKKTYTTEFCKKDKKLWAKSLLGQQAPVFEVEGWISKKPDMKNKFVLIDFWGIYCPQCKKAIPELNEINKKFKNKLVVVGVADNSKELVMSMKGHKIEYYSAFDTKRKLKSKYEVQGIPHVVIVAPDNTIVWEGFPFLRADRLTIDKISKIINQK